MGKLHVLEIISSKPEIEEAGSAWDNVANVATIIKNSETLKTIYEWTVKLTKVFPINNKNISADERVVFKLEHFDGMRKMKNTQNDTLINRVLGEMYSSSSFQENLKGFSKELEDLDKASTAVAQRPEQMKNF